MCGIVGLLSSSEPADDQLVRRMTETIVHRGPIEDGHYADRDVALGMRRLSIIDVEGGHQPVYSEDRSIVAVFNGEIYNYRELTDELKAKGHRFVTECDTEVIVHMYEEMGADCVTRFNGMFAFALWDTRQRRLMVSRDRLGVKPMYYYRDDRHFAFASELKSLLHCPFISREIDHDAIAEYLSFMYIRAPRTPLKKVAKLMPGHSLIVENGTAKEIRYWNLADHARTEPIDEDSAIEELRELLDDSIRLRLRSDVPVGAFLSGGIDSSAVVAMAARQLQQPLNTYTVGFAGGGGVDELPYARQVAARYATNHHETIVAVDDAIQNLPRLVWHLDEPNADSAVIPTYLVSKFAAESLRVVMTGVGGDELFGGYPRYFDGPRAEHIYRRLPHAVRRAISHGAALTGDSRAAQILKRNAASPAERYLTRVSMFSPAELRRVAAVTNGLPSLAREFAAYPGDDPLNRAMFVDALTYLPDDILHLTDRMSMAVSLEARTPFLDYRLVEFSQSLPGRFKMDPVSRRWKILLKKALEPLLPHEILHRSKWGFGGPVRQWMQNGLHTVARDLFRNSAAVDAGVVDGPAAARYLAERTLGSSNDAQRIWALLMLEVWCRVFLAKEPMKAPEATLHDLVQ